MTHHARIAATLAVVFLLMALEARRSRRNERALRARGAIEPSSDVYRLMRVVYPVAFIVPALEGWMRGGVPPAVWAGGAAVFVAAKGLKYWAIAALGDRWSFRVLVVRGAPLVHAGPYRVMKHPNYAGVAGEIAGSALIMGGLLSGIALLAAFSWLMARRIRVEEQALAGVS